MSRNDPQNNIVCLLTPAGSAAIAVVRLAGPLVPAFAAAHLSRMPQAGRCMHVELRDGGDVIDDPVAVLFGPEVLELSLHGGPYVVRAAIALAERFGFIAADWSEVANLVFEAANELERETLAALPAAPTAAAVRILLAQPKAWSAMLAANDRPAMRAALSDPSLTHLLCPPTVVIVGIANVGKSTLANRLFGQDRVIAADHPGTTRDWVGEPADLGGLVVTLVDTPGLRESADAIEQRAIVNARGVIAAATARVVLLDATQAWESQRDLIAGGTNEIVCVNKIDRPAVWAMDRVGIDDAIAMCAATGTGVGTLQQRLLRHYGCDDLTPDRPRAWTERQRTLLGSMIVA